MLKAATINVLVIAIFGLISRLTENGGVEAKPGYRELRTGITNTSNFALKALNWPFQICTIHRQLKANTTRPC